MLPARIPRWLLVIKRQGKPCVNCAEISDQWGAFNTITFPKTSRRTWSKWLSNRSFPDLTVTPNGSPACWNIVSFDSWALLCCEWSGSSPRSTQSHALHSTYREQYNLQWWRSSNSTSCWSSSGNNPNGKRKLSYRNTVKLKSSGFFANVARPQGKYGWIITGSTSLFLGTRTPLVDGRSPSVLSRALCVLCESSSWALSSMNPDDVLLGGGKKTHNT